MLLTRVGRESALRLCGLLLSGPCGIFAVLSTRRRRGNNPNPDLLHDGLGPSDMCEMAIRIDAHCGELPNTALVLMVALRAPAAHCNVGPTTGGSRT